MFGLILIVHANLAGIAQAQTDEEMAMEMAMSGSESGSPDGTATSSAIPLTKTEASPVVLWQMVRPDFSRVAEELKRLQEPSSMPNAPIATGPKLRNEAHVAFRYGNLPLARELFFGHLALGEESATADLQSIQFSEYFRRPAWQIRWGLAIGITGDAEGTNFDPIVAGTGSGLNAGQNFEGMEPSEMQDSEFQQPGSDDPSMMSGEEGMNGFDDGSGRRAAPAVSIPEASIVDEAIAERMTELTGLVGETLASGMSTRIASGAFGAALTNVAEEDPTQGYTVGGDSVSSSEKRMWVPGVLFIGEGASREMTELAAKEDIELLLYVVVSLKVARTEEVQNITRAKIVDCKTGKTLVASGAMDNREVKRLVMTERGTPESHVTEQLDTFWKIIDSKLKLAPLPNLTPEVARRRVSQLIADPNYSNLRKMAEVRLFQHKGWLTQEEVDLAFEIIAGADGTKILYGPKSESIPIIRQMVNYSLVKKDE
ncbi:hypothetical protein [Neorhodopirellula pilleata]|uniref:Uncharacterized protein n=1 Tax=Neorhodopirellula pilleata TaxID=2714738 RepID=A0A5C6A001_9BACT|nr:hypothetical protein [Neorhodopirellula pilleata]TWT92611.1 hypothetical protein Pla100_46310 [Neorhodopirellula pilleata]